MLFAVACWLQGCATKGTGHPDDGFAIMGLLYDPLGIGARSLRDPFDEALRKYDLKAIERQLKKNPALTQQGLSYAISTQSPALWDYFIANGAVVTTPPPGGASWLHVACTRLKPDVEPLHFVELLLARGVPVDIPNGNGETPLMRAITLRRYDIAGRLLSAGANANAVDKQGRTPLAHAIIWESDHRSTVDMIALLLKHGANPHFKLRSGETVGSTVNHQAFGWTQAMRDEVSALFLKVSMQPATP